jgi:1-acyl-sn-glycerol-3-phosphate acyltransferase
MSPIVPVPGPAVPRSGNALSRAMGRSVLALAGWRIDGSVPDLPHMVACVAPHTSNWDFVIGYATKMALGVRAHWLGKHTLFVKPFGRLMRAMGGIPVDRGAAHGVVAQAVAWFRDEPKLLLGVAPEGTRKKVDRWKTGFYHIAREAGVPIWPVALDWGTRVMRFGEPLTPTGDEAADMEVLYAFYRRVRGRHPDRAFPPSVD